MNESQESIETSEPKLIKKQNQISLGERTLLLLETLCIIQSHFLLQSKALDLYKNSDLNQWGITTTLTTVAIIELLYRKPQENSKHGIFFN